MCIVRWEIAKGRQQKNIWKNVKEKNFSRPFSLEIVSKVSPKNLSIKEKCCWKKKIYKRISLKRAARFTLKYCTNSLLLEATTEIISEEKLFFYAHKEGENILLKNWKSGECSQTLKVRIGGWVVPPPPHVHTWLTFIFVAECVCV